MACIVPSRQQVEGGLRRIATCPQAEVIPERWLHAGPFMREASTWERFRVTRGECGETFVGTQEWARAATDIVVRYGPEQMPTWIWRRETSPGRGSPAERTDLRVYSLIDSPARMRWRRGTSEAETWAFRRGGPRAVIAPGRGVLTMWLRRANLEVGERVRELVFDVREPIEVLREVTLERHADRQEGEQRWRVYTIYGREPVFADAENIVVGDMMGMRPGQPGVARVAERAGPVDPEEVP